MEIPVEIGRMYAVTTDSSCTVSLPGSMKTLVTATAGQQAYFMAQSNSVIISDDNAQVTRANFKGAPIVLNGGGASNGGWYAILKMELTTLLGEGNFKLRYASTDGGGAVTVAVKQDISAANLEEVRVLMSTIAPASVVKRYEWEDGLPLEYTRLEYLESTGTQFINTALKPHKLSALARWEVTSPRGGQILGWYQNVNNVYKIENESNANYTLTGIVGLVSTPVSSYKKSINDKPVGFVAEVEINADSEYIRINNNNYACTGLATGYSDNVSGSIMLFGQGGQVNPSVNVHARVMFIRFWRGGVELANFIPALDPETKQPGLYDTVSKAFKVNSGTGDFLYPGKETEATTYSLRNRMYGKITKHGIRRLYCVPEGYNSKEEYAEQNGFKILVETPQPEEGYWTPEWHEREDCIELEWVETEPEIEPETETEP